MTGTPPPIRIRDGVINRWEYCWAETHDAKLHPVKIFKDAYGEDVMVYIPDGGCVPWPRNMLAIDPDKLIVSQDERRGWSGLSAEDAYYGFRANPEELLGG